MRKSLGIVCAALWLTLAPGHAHAGLNANALAKMMWQVGTAAGLPARNSTIGTPQLVVVVSGVSSFRGADVQISMGALDGSKFLADAWQGNGTGGCNDGAWTFYLGGTGGAYPNIVTTSPPLNNGLVAVQNGELYNTGTCLTPCGTGLLWLQFAAGSGVTRDPATTYGVWAIKFDLTTPCAGGLNDPTPFGVCLTPYQRSPCQDAHPADFMTLVDANAVQDDILFSAGFVYLTWLPANGTGNIMNCPGAAICYTFPAPGRTWGTLRKLYR